MKYEQLHGEGGGEVFMENENEHMQGIVLPSLIRRAAEREALQRLPLDDITRTTYEALFEDVKVDDPGCVPEPTFIPATGELLKNCSTSNLLPAAPVAERFFFSRKPKRRGATDTRPPPICYYKTLP